MGGGFQSDLIRGGPGNDLLFGNTGRDALDGEAGRDTCLDWNRAVDGCERAVRGP